MSKPKFTISGSELAAILGLSPYDTPMDIYCRKMGLIEPKPENEPMRWGKATEHVVARRYEKKTGNFLFPSTDEGYQESLTHCFFPWWTGKPDRKIMEIIPNAPGHIAQAPGLLEIKVVGERMAYRWGEAPDGEVPDEYLCQVAWYMPLLGVSWADLAVQIGNRDFRIYHIKRDLELEKSLMEAAQDFLNNHLIPGIPPRIDASESSRTYLHKIFPRETEDFLENDREADDLALELRLARQNMKVLGNHEALLENKLKELIGSHAGVQGEWGRISWKANKNGLRIFRPVFLEEEEVENE